MPPPDGSIKDADVLVLNRGSLRDSVNIYELGASNLAPQGHPDRLGAEGHEHNDIDVPLEQTKSLDHI